MREADRERQGGIVGVGPRLRRGPAQHGVDQAGCPRGQCVRHPHRFGDRHRTGVESRAASYSPDRRQARTGGSSSVSGLRACRSRIASRVSCQRSTPSTSSRWSGTASPSRRAACDPATSTRARTSTARRRGSAEALAWCNPLPMMKASAGSRRLPSRCNSVIRAAVPSPQRTSMPAPRRRARRPAAARRGGVGDLEAVHLHACASEVAVEPRPRIEGATPSRPQLGRRTSRSGPSCGPAWGSPRRGRHPAERPDLVPSHPGEGLGQQFGTQLGETRLNSGRVRRRRWVCGAGGAEDRCPFLRRGAWS